MDAGKDEPRIDAVGGYLKKIGDHNAAEVIEVSESRIEEENLRK